ncbi:nucleic acid-binding protein, contains PIN domain protein [Candidatus Magnetoovum chiemensis]|nr:nucleic acid-binding protein, contains PIN domain protein [Candidatus Magnetoovum chiemensis]
MQSFFQSIDADKMFITDLALHSIGIILLQLNEHNVLELFIDDMIIDGITVICLTTSEIKQTINISKRFNLDFDDAYQYAAAQLYNLQIVSFDKDFDKTDKKRLRPEDVIL